MDRCERCRYFHVLPRLAPPPGDRLLGECRRYPPVVPATVVSIGAVEDMPLAVFPLLRAGESCGEFEQATSSQTASSEGTARQTTSKPVQDARLLVSVKEAARMLGISDRSLWQLSKDGVIQSVRIGGRVCYSPDALRAWIAGHQGQTSEGDRPRE